MGRNELSTGVVPVLTVLSTKSGTKCEFERIQPFVKRIAIVCKHMYMGPRTQSFTKVDTNRFTK
jgi:hypothetical protein